jgi:hypothetical protein
MRRRWWLGLLVALLAGTAYAAPVRYELPTPGVV